MKKLLSLLLCAMLLLGCSGSFDDSSLRKDLDDLENRVARLEEICKQMNTNISSLQTIVTALQGKLSITRVEQLSDGYVIHFSDNTTATIKNGKDSGNVPVIGVKKDTDGIYYWTKDGQWLTDDKGNKIKAQGTDGKDGVDGEDGTDGTNGKDGITPQLKIENGRWMLSTDSGETWTDIGQATGTDGTDGEDGTDGTDGTNGIFKSVTEDETNVYFTLADNSVITIPKGDKSQFAISFDTTDIAILNAGETKTISYTITGATEKTVVKTISQDGWKAKVNATSTSAGTITITAPNPIVESEILVFANDGSYRTVMATFRCYEKQVLEINIADNSIETSQDGGTQVIKLKTNISYSVDIPAAAKSWLSVASTRAAVREETLTFSIAQNDGISRFATVALKDERGNTMQTIIFRQLGTCTEIHVDTKGELETVLAGYDYANIKSLKITGELNDVDFLFIYHMMPNLKSLDISEVPITALPAKAFYNSKNVENLIFPNTLITIGTEIFYQSNLKSVIIPASVETIGASAFKGCSQLANVTFESGSQLKTIEGGYPNIVGYAGGGYGAFLYCTSLTSIEIPANVETIGASAFKGCSQLANVTFESGSQLKTIEGGYYMSTGYGAFLGCISLTSIEIPANVETIGKSAFKGCSQLANITFESGSQLKTIEGGYYSGHYDYSSFDPYSCPYGAFSDCVSLTSIEIPANVETIGASAFKGCSQLANVTFESGSQLKTIEGGYDFYSNISGSSYFYYYGAFSNCRALTSIEIPASVETIGASAFKGCSKLASVTFKTGSILKTIEGGYVDNNCYYGAFSDCTSLTSIEIPVRVETIGASAFKDCSKLASVTFVAGSMLKTIEGGYSASSNNSCGTFSNCISLTSIKVPASVETIGASAFKGCSQLASITFENGSHLKAIEGGHYFSKTYPYHAFYYGAFSDCTSLTSIEIPANVETIGKSAFKGCSKLASVTFKTGSMLKTIEGGDYYVYSSPHSYAGAFSCLANLITVDMSACTQVATIGKYTFVGCSELRLFKIGTVTPPSCNDSALSGINANSILKVPAGCVDTYKKASGWSDFTSITELDK